ncbi:YcgJ family protein [Agrobacterium tumefaciens]|uniref:YcgJ family protein n=1 Tax=Agrobacterium tumefaciens TaxID=358 RepID=UPI001B8A7355|nr:YcgJ family protein [Agrobacterium tumefaciens]WCK69157.1 YcgJ family protein [Agrobacterium tumefaciens]
MKILDGFRMRRLRPEIVAAIVIVTAIPAVAGTTKSVRSPQPGVLCDQYMCVDASGVSRTLTEKFRGATAAMKLFAQGDFRTTQFAFANGVFCDTQERACHTDRYFDRNGKRSPIDIKMTDILFKD